MSERIDEIWEMAADGLLQRVRDSFDGTRIQISKSCESPIEVLFAAAFCTLETPIYDWHGGLYLRPIPIFCGTNFSSGIYDLVLRNNDAEQGVYILPQHEIGKYRADFLIVGRFGEEAKKATKVIVECDGHDFHERTKEQARRDKARDRFFTTNGYRVMRFTGSELYLDPFACAKEVMDYLDDVVHGEAS